MVSAIGGVAAALHLQHTASAATQQAQPAGSDSDGDNDGSGPGDVEQAAAALSSGTIGNNIDTTA